MRRIQSINIKVSKVAPKWTSTKDDVVSIQEKTEATTIPEIFRYLLRSVNSAGFPFFVDCQTNRNKFRMIMAAAVFNGIINLLCLRFVILGLQLGEYEDTGILIMFMGHVWLGLFYLWKNMRKLEKILKSMFKHVSLEEKRFLNRMDRKYFLGPVAVVLLSIPVYITYILIRLKYKPNLLTGRLLGLNKNITSKIIENILVTVVYVMYTFGNVATIIRFYLINCFVFEGYAWNLSKKLDDILSNRITAEAVREVRDRLRGYYSEKVKAEKLVNIFPFLWLSYLMLTGTSYFTKAATDWKQEQESSETFFVVNTYVSVLYFASTAIASMITERADNRFKECIQKSLSLSDPRRGDFSPTDMPVDVKKEILLLHHELANRPQTSSSVFGMTTFDRGMLLSFVGNLINFAVMVINIRIALKSGNASISKNETVKR